MSKLLMHITMTDTSFCCTTCCIIIWWRI